jgi:hypothetical protein
MEMDCIPAGMELLPAVDEEQFEFIKRVIDDCDYYLLIIGGRYGSTTTEGTNYTEKEYDYAVSRGISVLAFIHKDPDSIPFGKSEQDPSLRERLQQFRDKVCTNRVVKFWESAEELPGLVSLSLNKTIKMFPAVGWVRANKTASEELWSEINQLRKESSELQKQLTEVNSRPDIENLATLEDQMLLFGTYWQTSYLRRSSWTVTISWSDIFTLISAYMDRNPSDEYVKGVLTEAVFSRSGESSYGKDPSLDDQTFRTVVVQLKALRLVTLTYAPTANEFQHL